MLFISIIFLVPNDKVYKVEDVISPVEFNLGDKIFKYDYEIFDRTFTKRNRELAKKFSITEEEAFILGNLSHYAADKLMRGRKVYIKNDEDLVYLKYGYRDKFYYSGYCLKDSELCYKTGFDKVLSNIRKITYKVVDLDSDMIYDVSDKKVHELNNFIVVSRYNLPRKKASNNIIQNASSIPVFSSGDIKIYFTDSTSKIKPDRECSSSICKEILSNINAAQKTIDMAIYGYSGTPLIENALKNAIKRGVKIRLVCDSDIKGGNIYPDTKLLLNLIKDNKSDINSPEVKSIMHNKFYIFDDKVIITGSANLSHTDMSGFNSNSIVVINSEEAAKIYKKEFEQLHSGKFHNEKSIIENKKIKLDNTEIQIYFSPKDKGIYNAILPIINKAEKYIYIPTFVLTDKRVANALVTAKSRGVDVRIIIDALNASVQHSKHNALRNGGVLVKTENYAGKMHSKSMMVDDKYTIVGSMNFSNSGENYNDENMLVIKSNEITKFYRKFFEYQWGKIDDKWLKYNARAEGKDSIGSCSDGLDNNYDGLTDKDDAACRN